jgi:hypothetical protein
MSKSNAFCVLITPSNFMCVNATCFARFCTITQLFCKEEHMCFFYYMEPNTRVYFVKLGWSLYFLELIPRHNNMMGRRNLLPQLNFRVHEVFMSNNYLILKIPFQQLKYL